MRARRQVEKRWRALIKEQERSGRSLRSFALSKRISPNTLAYWKYKRFGRGQADRRGFALVRLVGGERTQEADTGFAEVLAESGRVIRLRRGFDPVLLMEALAALERTC